MSTPAATSPGIDEAASDALRGERHGEKHAREWIRGRVMRLLFDEREIVLRSGSFPIEPHFEDVDSLGLYLHIPFCRRICPYCPYNKELYRPEVAERYTAAVLSEIARYAAAVGNRPITSFYVGGGTPTTMLDSGLGRIFDAIYRTFNMQCGIHLESHPNDLSPANLDTIQALGVEHLSIGVEALQDHHLRLLCRPYTAAQVTAAISRTVERGFRCVNVDLIFALPNQTDVELRQAAETLTALGVDQVAAYPLFSFDYTRWPQLAERHGYRGRSLPEKRHMLKIMEDVFYSAGFERSSVWAFTRAGKPRYCSVTVPQYLGLGASGASYLRDIFYVNTFNVNEYILALADNRLPIALSMSLSEQKQMAGWLYWRVYETRFRKSDFRARFGCEFDAVYGRLLGPLAAAGLALVRGEEIVLTDSGAYWLHALQDLFSIDYVSMLWGTSQDNPWPTEVVLAG